MNRVKSLFIFNILFFFTYAFWPPEENSLTALALGALVIGFWFGRVLDEEYFHFTNQDNIVLKIISVVLAVIGFIQLKENLLKEFKTSFTMRH